MVSGSEICAGASTGDNIMAQSTPREIFRINDFITLAAWSSVAGVAVAIDDEFDVFDAVDEIIQSGGRVAVQGGARNDQQPFGVPSRTADQAGIKGQSREVDVGRIDTVKTGRAEAGELADI